MLKNVGKSYAVAVFIALQIAAVHALTWLPLTSDEVQKSDESSEYVPVFGWRLKITDLALVATNFLLVGATLFLWRSTRDLVRGGERHSERDLRAYVHPYFPEPPSLDSDPFKVVFFEKNYGRTPAYNVAICTAVKYVELPLSEALAGCIPDTRTAMIPPGAFIRTGGRFKRALSEKEKADIRNGKTAICIWGKITYTDVFEESRDTQFRLLLNKKAVELERLVWDQEGNEAT